MSDLPTPHDREEVILNAMATGETIECPEPHTRKEIYLKEIYENGGGGGGGGEGVTPSQVVSIIASKTDSELDATSTNAVQNQAVYAALDDKVDVEDGKGLIASGDVAQISVNAAAIQTLNAGATQEGSVDKKIADALKVYMQKEPGKGLIAESDVEQIGTNKSAIETLNGSTATAGSVDKKISDALTNYVAKEDGKGLVSSTDVAQIGTNKTAIETLNGNASTDGSVDKKIATALGNYVEKETGKGLVSSTDVAQIGTNKSAIETLNGDASTTGSVDKKIADNLKGYVVKVGGKSLVLDEDITQITTNKNDIATLNSDETTEGSVAKKIADALVDVNDEVSDLKDALDYYGLEQIKVTFLQGDKTADNPTADTCRVSTDFVSCKSGDKIRVEYPDESVYVIIIAFFNSSKTLLSKEYNLARGSIVPSFEAVAPTNTAYVSCIISRDTIVSSFTPNDVKTFRMFINNAISDIKTSIDNIEENNLTTISFSSKSGAYRGSDGTYFEHPYYKCSTELLPITPNSIIRMVLDKSSSDMGITLYGSDKSYLGSSANINRKFTSTEYECSVPNNAYYYGVTWRKNDDDTFANVTLYQSNVGSQLSAVKADISTINSSITSINNKCLRKTNPSTFYASVNHGGFGRFSVKYELINSRGNYEEYSVIFNDNAISSVKLYGEETSATFSLDSQSGNVTKIKCVISLPYSSVNIVSSMPITIS